MKRLNLRQYFSGLLPFFYLAHFGHHVVGAMLRPLMPMIRTDFNLSYTQAGLTMSAFSLTNGISNLPSGWLADRIRPRVMVLLSVTGVAVAGLFIGLSHSYAALIGFLVLAAIMGGGYHPASSATISLSVPQEYRGRSLALHFVAGASAFWVVPLVVAPIAVTLGWHGPYLILTAPTILLGIVLYILMGSRRYTRVGESPKVDKEVTTSARIPWRKLLPFIIITVTTGTMIQSVNSYLSLYAVDKLGITAAAAAMLTAITPAVVLVAAPLGGYLSDRFGSVPVLLLASSLAIPLVYLLGAAHNVATLAALMVAIGIVSNARIPTSESYITGNTPQHRRAMVLGLYFFSETEVAGVLAPVMGNLIDRFGFYSTFAIASASIAMVVVVCSLFLWRNRDGNRQPTGKD